MADEKQNEELQIPIEWDYEKFKNSAEFRGIKRNKKGQFVPNNEQLRLLVRYEEIKLSEIDTSEVTDMSRLFEVSMLICRKNEIVRQDFSGIDEWDTSKVETFERMFYHARKFNENISGWDTSSAKNFRGMFWNAIRFNQPIGKWNTSNVTDTSGMFWEAWRFNQPLNEWDTSSVTNMKGMFYQTKFNQDINDWNVSKVTDFSNMFSGGVISENYGVFNKPLDKWDVSSAENMSGMFKNVINFEQDLSAWGNKLGKLQDMCDMFSGVGKYDSAPKPVFSSVVKNPFYGIGEKALKKINILETWYVRDFCKVIEPECKMDDKELKEMIEFLEKRKHPHNNMILNPRLRRLYEKLTNPQYIKQMRELEKTLKTPKTRVGKFDSSVGISILNDKDKEWENAEKKAEKNAVENAKFLEDRKWIPENIKEQFKAFLLTEDDKNAAINTWDKAYCEVFGLRFKIKRYKKRKGK